MGTVRASTSEAGCWMLAGRARRHRRRGRDETNHTWTDWITWMENPLTDYSVQPVTFLLRLFCSCCSGLMICSVCLPWWVQKGRNIWHGSGPMPRCLTLSRGYIYLSVTPHGISTMPVKSGAKILGAFHIWPHRQSRSPAHSWDIYHLVTLEWTKFNILSDGCPHCTTAS